MEQCSFGEACTNYKCPFLHPPSWWVCDYGPLCFVSGCPGVHPPVCKASPCPNIRHCNMVHLQACVHGAGCANTSCHALHPPPCDNDSCNGNNCPFMHPSNPKYQHITSLSIGGGGQGGGQRQPKQPKSPWPQNPGASPSQSYNQPPPQASFGQQTDKSNVPCRFAPNCTKPNCPFKH